MNEFKIARDLGANWLESQIKNNGIIGDSTAGVTTGAPVGRGF